ncbi:MAG: DUF3179 domain-containing protein [Gemmatimonadota bacterium]|nr:DUF3179 domain-containing protein [Gemmatimonadota bacterium]
MRTRDRGTGRYFGCLPTRSGGGIGLSAGFVLVVTLAACDGGDSTGLSQPNGPSDGGSGESGTACRVSTDDILGLLGPDAIPALTNPPLVAPDHEDASYLSEEDRVVGLVVDGSAYAFPLNVLRWHENVNIDAGDEQLAVSYCPLTGTALTFDRSVVDGAELGVSGLLFRNNLVLYDRGSEDRSFFPQMLRSAQCGPLSDRELGLPMVASWEMRWDAWKDLFPDTRVLSRETGFRRDYTSNPNVGYEEIDNPRTLFPLVLDPRRPPKERVLGIPTGGDGGPAYPFEELAESERRAIHVGRAPGGRVVFWSAEAEAAIAFRAEVDDQALSFTASAGGYVDRETGSTWRLDGLAVSGPLEGRRLEPVAESYVAFWFAWADFHPETWVWRN